MATVPRSARKAPPRSKPETDRKPDGTTTPLSEPPQVSLYTRHAIAIARAMEFMFDHWLSFAELVPEACLDGVQEDATYRQEQREAAKYGGYEPVENLATIVRMAEERSKDQTPSPSQSDHRR